MDVTAILPSPLPCPPLTMGQKSKLFSVIYRISISWCLSHSLSSSLGTPGFHFALHPYTYCVLPCLIYLCMPLFFMGKASLSFKLGCLDKYHSSLKIQLRYYLIQVTFPLVGAFPLYFHYFTFSVILKQYFCLSVFCSINCKHLRARTVSCILTYNGNDSD